MSKFGRNGAAFVAGYEHVGASLLLKSACKRKRHLTLEIEIDQRYVESTNLNLTHSVSKTADWPNHFCAKLPQTFSYLLGKKILVFHDEHTAARQRLC